MNIRNRVKALRTVKASELFPNPKNWRTHPKAQQDALKGILAEVGYADALLARELPDGSLMLVDGHLRAETTPEQEVPVLILDINEAEADKLLLSLDPLAALAETNAQALDALLREVDTGSEGLQQMYADMAEAAELYQDGDKDIVEDEVPEPPVDPITKPGDLWLLGEHRLLCGDSTKAEDVARLMAGAKANCMVTDPPYGIGIASNPVRQKHAKADWDAKPVEPRAFVESVSQSIVWGGNYFDLPPAKGFFVWDKKQPEDLTLAMCEMAWTNVDTPAKMFRLSVTSYDKEHPTQKPVGLIAWCLSYAGGDVFDPFLGSGTTLIAAEQLGRKCYGMEISPQYCDVIVKRWETLTGKKATLEDSDGQARATQRADDHQDRQGQPRQKAAEQKRTKAAKR
jgi:site-specific DNA-methyltransferase (adenine-specific)/modification methylase